MRRNRKLEFGASYYLTCNINRFKEELKEDDIKELFVTTLKRAKEKFKFDVYDIIILNDHFHMVLKPDPKDKDIYLLSKIMQWILSVFAINYNKKTGLKGKVWYDRFKSEIIETAEEIVKFVERIKANFVRFGIDKIANYRFCAKYFIDIGSSLITPIFT